MEIQIEELIDNKTNKCYKVFMSKSVSSPDGSPIDHTAELAKANAAILHRVEALEHLSMRGCAGLRFLSAKFKATRERLSRECGDCFAFLKDANLLQQIEIYEFMNKNMLGDAPGIGKLIENRRLHNAFVIYERVLHQDSAN